MNFQGAGLVEDRCSDSGSLVYLDVEKFNNLTTLGKYPFNKFMAEITSVVLTNKHVRLFGSGFGYDRSRSKRRRKKA